MLLRKGGTATDRVSTALANLQRSAYAIGMLRTRVETRMNEETAAGKINQQELAKVLQLVSSAQALLKEMSAKAESARFLEEFIAIISSTAGPVGEIHGEMRELVPMAEAALAEMQQAISNVSTALSPASKEDIDASILAQASALTAPESTGVSATSSLAGCTTKKIQSATPKEKTMQLEEVAL